MGLYELIEGKVVNGRGVWQYRGTSTMNTSMSSPRRCQRFLYYVSTRKWRLSDREDMEEGKARGYLRVASSALTPDQVLADGAQVWRAWDQAQDYCVDVPCVRVSRYLNDLEI